MSGFLLNPFTQTQIQSSSDSYFGNVSLLLNGDGSAGTQNNTFVDSSANSFTITRTGNTTQGAISPYSSNWSVYFDGNGDYLSIPTNTAFNFGTGDFTIECYANLASIGGLLVTAADGTGGLFFGFQSSTSFGYGRSGVAWDYTTTVSISTNQWHHYVMTRSGTSIRLFIDGQQVGATQTSSTSYNIGATNLLIGGFVGSFWVNGYISNVRIIKGSAQYTANFTPPTSPLSAISGTSLLGCQANRFLDASTNAFTVTPAGNVKIQKFSPFGFSNEYSTTTNGGSVYLDGSGDYLDVGSTAYSMAGNWTIELWFNGTSTNAILFDGRPDGINGFYPTIVINSSTQLNFYYNTTDHFFTVPSFVNIWNHIAVVKNSTTITIYLNGSSVYTVADSNTWNIGTSRPRIGANGGFYSGAPGAFIGYISDVRIVNGTAIYTTNFTPTTSPLTAVTNTQLLLGFKNAGIIDSTTINNMETVGNVQINTSIKKYGSGSLYFDGSGDSLIIPTKEPLKIAGDFTIEGWMYLATSSISYPHIFSVANGYTGIRFGDFGFSYLFQFGINLSTISGVYSCNYSQSQLANQWVHFAWTRASGVNKLYVNGVQQLLRNSTSGSFTLASFTDSSTFGNTTAWTLGGSWNGYIDDLRITNGIVRYTADFTPPTVALPAK